MIPPGVMLYYELAPAIAWLDEADRGQLLTAILAYGHDGVVPDFTGALAAIWALIMPRIDRDAEAYRTKVLDARYAAYARECKRNGMTRSPKDVWLATNAGD